MKLKRSFSFSEMRKRDDGTVITLSEFTDGLTVGVSTYSHWELSGFPTPDNLILFLREYARKHGINESQFMEEQLNNLQQDVKLGIAKVGGGRKQKAINLAYIHELEKASDFMWMADIDYRQPEYANIPDIPLFPTEVVEEHNLSAKDIEKMMHELAGPICNSVLGATQPIIFKMVTSQIIRNSLYGGLVKGCLTPQMQKSLKKLVLPAVMEIAKGCNKELRELSEQLAEPLQNHNKLVAAGVIDSYELCEGFEDEHARLQELKDQGFPWDRDEVEPRITQLLRSPLSELRALPETSVERKVYDAITDVYERGRRQRFSGDLLIAISVLTQTPLKQLFLGMMEQNRLVGHKCMSDGEVGKVIRALSMVYNLPSEKLTRVWADSIPVRRKYKNED